MDTSDIKVLLEWMHSEDYTDETIDTYKNVIKVFWKWLNDGEHPPETDWITLSNSTGNGTLPKDLLTKEDIQQQLEAAKNPRDKAFISILYETGARIGELIDLTVGDIEDRTNGKKIVIEGKTGARRLPLVESVPHLNQWLGNHPDPEPEAPLWCTIQQHGPDEHLNVHQIDDIRDVHGIGSAYASRLEDAGIEDGTDLVNHDAAELADIADVTTATAEKWLNQFDSTATLTTNTKLNYRYIREKILQKTMNRADINKPSNPHHYRHTRASYLATKMTESQLCEWFGWVQGSNIPSRYVHLSGRDLDNAYDQMHGLYEPDEDEQEPDVIECERCQEINEPNAAFCMRCGFALDQQTVAELEEETDSKIKQSYRRTDPHDDQVINEIDAIEEALERPEVKNEIIEIITSDT